MNTKFKLILVLSLIFISIVMLFGWTVYYFQNKYAFLDFYKRLETRASIAAKCKFDPDTLNTETLKTLRNQHLEKLEKEKEYIFRVDSVKNVDLLSAKHKLPESFLNTLLEEDKAREKRKNTFFVGKSYFNKSNKYLVIVSAENYYVSHHLIFLRNILITGLCISILIISAVSIYLSRHIFDPIRQITDKVKQISTESIHLRVENNNNTTEITELINTFNDLLNRIETSFETQKNFISNASHELGTPLTAIIGEADVSLLKTRTAQEYENSLRNILHQAERLDQITKSLLFLAQTAYKGKAITFETIRIDEIIWETKKIIDNLNPDNQILVDLTLLPEDPKKLKVKGNKQLLHLAFANILNNACKYSNNGPVMIYIASSDSRIIVTIKDQGIGIPDSEIAYIYDPFFRASNTKLFEGYGIGLPLSRNVVHLHKGTLTVTSTVQKGTTVEIKLPLIYSSKV